MLGAFRFVDGGKTYVCQPESLEGVEGAWWRFTVSSDSNKYAPFKAESRDTRANVQTRIVAYYTNHLARRAMPDQSHWANRGKGGPGRPKGPGTAAGVAGAAGVAVPKAGALQAVPVRAGKAGLPAGK